MNALKTSRLLSMHPAGIVALSVLAILPGAWADQVTVSSYSFDAATATGSFVYDDHTGTELTDGQYGIIGFTSQAQADPWVGWFNVSPKITFNFASPVDITEVDLDLAFWTSPAIIYLPTSVTIGTTVFPLTGNELSNPSRGTLKFDVNLTGVTSLDVTLTNGEHDYLFIDEAQFFGGTSGPVGTPEPAALPVALAGLIAMFWIARKRQRKTARA